MIMSVLRARIRERGFGWMGTVVALLMISTTACGPRLSLEIGIREKPVDVPFGERLAPPPVGPLTEAPIVGGIITGGIRTDFGTPRGTPPLSVLGPLSPSPVCPVAAVDAAAEEAAPSRVTKGPKPGLYRMKRTGYLKVGEPNAPADTLRQSAPAPLSDEIARLVTNVQETQVPGSDTPVIRFDVVQVEPGVRTTTSYIIDPAGADVDRNVQAGLRITKIQLEDADLPGSGPAGSAGEQGVETFTPQPPIKIMDLPAGPQPPFSSSRGDDPSIAATMQFVYATQTRVNVDICGRVIQGWRVRVSFPEPTVSQISQYSRQSVRSYQFSGEFVFAPQFSLILQDDFTLGINGSGRDPKQRPFEFRSASILKSIDPQ